MKWILALVFGVGIGAGALFGLGRAGVIPIGPRNPTPTQAEDDHASTDDPHAREAVVRLSEAARTAAGIRVETAASSPLPRGLEATAVIKLNEDRLVHITPRVSARVEGVAGLSVTASPDCDLCETAAASAAVLGADVKEGDVLAVLDSIELGLAKAEFLRLEDASAIAKANFEREERLLSEGTTSEKEVLDAKGEYLNTQALLNSAREKLLLLGLTSEEIGSLSWTHKGRASHFHLRAPMAGRIIEKHATAGEVVGPERSLFTVADLSSVWILHDIYEQHVSRVRLGQTASVYVPGYDAAFEGQVTFISDLVDEETRTVKARVEVPNPNGRLKPGMFVRSILRESDEGETAILLPEDAIQQMDGGPVAFVEVEPGTYERRDLRMAPALGSQVAVLAGIEPGEMVVVSGAFWLKSHLLRGSMGEGHGH